MFEKNEGGRSRRIAETQARARAEGTRRAMLDLLREGPMSGVDLRARLAEDAPISVVNYHLAVLESDREIVSENGIYRLA
jgi:DNA-binding transcriptional ArsR family regulator